MKVREKEGKKKERGQKGKKGSREERRATTVFTPFSFSTLYSTVRVLIHIEDISEKSLVEWRVLCSSECCGGGSVQVLERGVCGGVWDVTAYFLEATNLVLGRKPFSSAV